ncbi:biotin-dependent carboxyltransferase family protein [Solibacillus sp. CAU 1738]|uniref:5-oxoprolinase subunit C family protein n=1 Tax=Solibacillus sp. CAU 1738 TaxID=3140363 RepID=UPI00326166A8
MTIVVLKPGFFSTIQDAGRIGQQQYGVIVSGAMDQLSYEIANTLLNQSGTAAIEMTLVGPTLRFEVDTVIACTGADFSPLLNDAPCPMWQPVTVKAGSVLKCQAAKQGARGYIAFKHGIQVPEVLGSRSTYLRAQIGGFKGRALQKGDQLPIKLHSEVPRKYSANYKSLLSFSNSVTIRIAVGTEWYSFTENSKQTLTSIPYTVTKDADRMGYRLESHSALERVVKEDLISEAVTFGTIQVPPNGQPIILMADRQTTGGYPKIAQVIKADLPKLAQLQPMSTIHFEIVSLEEAQKIYLQQQQQLAFMKTALSRKE